MNPIFYDQLPLALIQSEGEELSFQNQQGKKLFPNLEQEKYPTEYLQTKMPNTKGEITIKGKDFTYTRQEIENVVLYTLQEKQSFPLDREQCFRILCALRESMAAITTASQGLARGKDLTTGLSTVNINLAKLQRVVSNCQILVDEDLPATMETMDVVGLVSNLSGEINTMFSNKSVLFSTKEFSVIVMGNSHYFSKALMGLIANGFQKSAQVKIQLKKNKTHVLIELRDTSKLPIVRPVIDILSGKTEAFTPTPTDGAGLSLLVVQKILKALDYQLWVQTPETGGLQLTISIPLPAKDQITGFMGDPDAPLSSFLDDDGGFSDILLNLSTVLEEKNFCPADLDDV
ncbi:MAG: hypothetical protein R3Y63_01935 [Eubacteriales bacterium]